ncbi:MAG: sugar ABC transporter ATP-binding protein, partial [Lachnospiraceae bacterium]|nr:sugar ABC transporter ATP-binding protein [Lachnospiraceae bacterium]
MDTVNAPLLKLQGIKKDFFGNQVLTDINLELHAGEVLGLCGENGAGKSTLMKILFGAADIAETGGYGGDIFLDGEKVSFSSPFEAIAAGIGMVHQEFSLIPGFDATENILLNREPEKYNFISEIFGKRLNTLDRVEMDRRAKESIEKMGVAIDRHMMINTMPVGHKQFTEIARELSKEQLRLLILDEPTAVLTEKEAEALLDSIRGMSERGISVIFITHRLQEILSVCNTVAVMRDGVLVECEKAENMTVASITKSMVGRSVEGRTNDGARTIPEDAPTVLKIDRLWVDMPGET